MSADAKLRKKDSTASAEVETVDNNLSARAAEASHADESRDETVEDVEALEKASSRASEACKSAEFPKIASTREATDAPTTGATAPEVSAGMSQNLKATDTRIETPSEAANETQPFEETFADAAEKVCAEDSFRTSTNKLHDFISIPQDDASADLGSTLSDDAPTAEDGPTETTKAAQSTDAINETASQAETSENKTDTETVGKAFIAEGFSVSELVLLPQDGTCAFIGETTERVVENAEKAMVVATEAATTGWTKAQDTLLKANAVSRRREQPATSITETGEVAQVTNPPESFDVDEGSESRSKENLEKEIGEETVKKKKSRSKEDLNRESNAETDEDGKENLEKQIREENHEYEKETQNKQVDEETNQKEHEKNLDKQTHEEVDQEEQEEDLDKEVREETDQGDSEEEEDERKEQTVEKTAEQLKERQAASRPVARSLSDTVTSTFSGAFKRISVTKMNTKAPGFLSSRRAVGSVVDTDQPLQQATKNHDERDSEEHDHQACSGSQDASLPNDSPAVKATARGRTSIMRRISRSVSGLKTNLEVWKQNPTKPVFEVAHVTTESPQQFAESPIAKNERDSEECFQQESIGSQDASLPNDSPIVTTPARGSIIRRITRSVSGLKTNLDVWKTSPTERCSEKALVVHEPPEQSVESIVAKKNAELASLKKHLRDIKAKLKKNNLLEESLAYDVEELEEQIRLKEQVAEVLARSPVDNFAS